MQYVSRPSILEFVQTSRIKYWISFDILVCAFHFDIIVTDQAGVTISL